MCEICLSVGSFFKKRYVASIKTYVNWVVPTRFEDLERGLGPFEKGLIGGLGPFKKVLKGFNGGKGVIVLEVVGVFL